METFSHCIRFALNKHLIIVGSEKTRVIGNDLNDLYECTIDAPEFIRTGNDYALVLDGVGHGYKIDITTQSLQRLLPDNDIRFTQSYFENWLPVYKSQSIYGPIENGMFNIAEGKIIWTNKHCEADQFVNGYYLGRKEKKICRADHLNGDMLWQHLLKNNYPSFKDIYGDTKEVETEKLLGVYENELWVKLNNQGLLVLDVNTGEELHYFDELINQPGAVFLSAGKMYFNRSGRKLQVLAYSTYIEIDLGTCRSVKKKLDDGWNIGDGQFSEDGAHVYFIGNQGIPQRSIGNLSVGILNTQTLAVEWHYTMPDEERGQFFTKTPQANDKYFGVCDSNGILCLFKR